MKKILKRTVISVMAMCMISGNINAEAVQEFQENSKASMVQDREGDYSEQEIEKINEMSEDDESPCETEIIRTSDNDKIATQATKYTTRVHFIANGGQEIIKDDGKTITRGDAILIENNGEYALIDAGVDSKCEKYLERLRKKRGLSKLKIKYMILTHHHNDHYNGLNSIIANPNIEIQTFIRQKNHGDITANKGCNKSGYKSLITKINNLNKAKTNFKNLEYIYTLNAKDAKTETKTVKKKIGDATLYIYRPFRLASDADVAKKQPNQYENNRSIMCRLECGKRKYLFTGDVYNEIINRIVKFVNENDWRKILNTNVLKLQHHGIIINYLENKDNNVNLEPNITTNDIYKDKYNATRYYITNARTMDQLETPEKFRNDMIRTAFGNRSNFLLTITANKTKIDEYSYTN